MQKNRKTTYHEDIREALLELGGRVDDLKKIYKRVEQLRRDRGQNIPRNFTASVRRSFENYCEGSENLMTRSPLFYFPEGKGRGVWGVKK